MNTRRHVVFAIFSTACIPAFSQTNEPASFNHGIKWDSLMKLDGKYLQDKAATAMLSPSLKKLLGTRFNEFMDSIKVQTPMEVENGLLLVKGMAPHSGGDYASLAMFGMKGTVLAVIKKESNLEYFGDKQILQNPMAKEAIKSLTS